MGAKQCNLIWLSALMLPAQFAFADNAGQAQSGNEQASPSRSIARISNFRFSFPPLEEQLGSTKPQAHPGAELSSAKNDDAGKNAVTGLHWTGTDSHPGLGYRVNSNEDVRVHLGRHGAVMNFALHF